MRPTALACLLFLSCIISHAGEPAENPLAKLPPPEPIPADAPLEEGYERIFNGTDLTGWEGKEGLWVVEKGMLIGRSTGIKQNEFIGYKENFKDFILKFKFQLVAGTGKGMINSGCQFRSQRVPNSTEACGYQADIGEGWWGALYDESRRNKVLVKPAKEDVEKALKRNQWNDYVVQAQGDKIVLEINGVKMIEWTETEPAEKVARDGRIFFQVHSGGPLEIRLKDIRIKKF
jgi:Domain of Unknown Function (DUF1080)